ncbi:MAG: hypothetical protein KDA84_25830 [Planctomycetaceae bacterium]|nr:hypothetical protein [Planctomycetaceae bacterium]
MKLVTSRILASCILLTALAFGTWDANADSTPNKKDQPSSSNSGLVFQKAFGRKTNPKLILKLPNGFLIGFDNWEIDQQKGVMRFTNCFIVDGRDFPKKPKVAIYSRSGLVPMKGRSSEYRLDNPRFADLIQSISFPDGSQFVFPNVIDTDDLTSQETVR